MIETSNKNEAYKLAKTQGWLSIAGNTVLCGFKFWAGLTIGSVAIMADAWHTLSDSLSSVILLVGVKIASRPPDAKHPYGHGRAELVTALVIGVMLAVIAFEFCFEGIGKIRNPQVTNYGWLGIVAMVVSILIKELMAQYAFWCARRSGLTSLRADAWHHRSDAISSVILLAGILVGSSWLYLDGVMALIVAVIIGYAAFDIFRGVWDQILGKEIEPELKERITGICKREAGTGLESHHFHIHEYGCSRTELTFHIRMPGNISLAESHALAQHIEDAIERELGIESTIHIEPA